MGRVLGADLVPAGSQVEQIDQRAAHLLAHVGCGCARCDELGHFVEQADVVGLFGRARMMMPVASGELGHDYPDHEETHCCLDVRTMRDGEPLVGLGEEHVEPHSGADRGHETAEAVPEGRHRDDDGDEDERRRRIGEVPSEGDEDGSDSQREDEGGGEGDLVSIRAESVHGCLPLVWCSQFSTVTVQVEEGSILFELDGSLSRMMPTKPD